MENVELKKNNKPKVVIGSLVVIMTIAGLYTLGSGEVMKKAFTSASQADDKTVKGTAKVENTVQNIAVDQAVMFQEAEVDMGASMDMKVRVAQAPSKADSINIASSSVHPHFIKDTERHASNEPAPTTDVDIQENAVKLVKDDPISTFSVDADDGAYKLFKSNLAQGKLLDEDFVRTEEFINAFQYNYDSPSSVEKPFSTEIKIAPSPWSDNHLLLVGIKGYEYKLSALPPVNLTFLVDVSGSMRSELPTIKTGLKMLVNKLRPEDSISLVTYAGGTRVVLSNTKIAEKSKIMEALSNLNSGGGTNGEAGILLAYNENKTHFVNGGVNRIILMSDGDFNVGLSNRSALEDLIKEKRKLGVTFSTIGIGGSNYQDQMMEQMANKGNGNYTFLGDILDAREVFADRFIPTLKNVAADVKYQIEFNGDNVKEYRLIGYENRMLKTEDFNNDKVDAGELPSGTTTTAIYEITLSDQKGLFPDSRYDKKSDSKPDPELANELAYLKIRFKQPNADVSELLTFNVDKSLLDSALNDDNTFAINVAGFAQLYKNSDYLSSDYTYDRIIENLEKLTLDSSKQKFVDMVKTTKELVAIK